MLCRRFASLLLVISAVASGLAGCSPEGARSRRPAPEPRASWFADVTDEIGLDFVHDAGAGGKLRLPEIMGPGVALFDADGDGRLDLYLINGGPAGASAPPPVNRLFRQRPDGTLADVTEASGLGDPGYGMGVAVGDVDNDGDPDVYVTNNGPDRLYRNLGDGRFEQVTRTAGIHVSGWSASATFCDYDGDGWLDLYVTRYVVDDPRRMCTDAAGRPEYCTPEDFSAASDVLLHNEGGGRFTDASDRAGISTTRAAGLGVVCEDLDEDGRPDFYVANDLDANQLWINQGDGTFVDRARITGVAYNLEGRSESGMGVIAADLNGDLRPDLFVTHLEGQTNTLYGHLGSGLGFEDATAASGLAASSLPFTGFGVAAFDVELDGDLDLAIANGRVVRGQRPVPTALPAPWDDYAEPNLFYLGDGRGHFEPAGDELAAFTGHAGIARGLAAGDLDGDGDVDVAVSHTASRARLYRNEAPRKGDWLIVRAEDPRLKRLAIGARVTLAAGTVRQTRTIGGGYGYLSSHDPRAHFGFSSAAAGVSVEVRWPDGKRERFDAPGRNRVVTLVRGEGEALR